MNLELAQNSSESLSSGVSWLIMSSQSCLQQVRLIQRYQKQPRTFQQMGRATSRLRMNRSTSFIYRQNSQRFVYSSVKIEITSSMMKANQITAAKYMNIEYTVSYGLRGRTSPNAIVVKIQIPQYIEQTYCCQTGSPQIGEYAELFVSQQTLSVCAPQWLLMSMSLPMRQNPQLMQCVKRMTVKVICTVRQNLPEFFSLKKTLLKERKYSLTETNLIMQISSMQTQEYDKNIGMKMAKMPIRSMKKLKRRYALRITLRSSTSLPFSQNAMKKFVSISKVDNDKSTIFVIMKPQRAALERIAPKATQKGTETKKQRTMRKLRDFHRKVPMRSGMRTSSWTFSTSSSSIGSSSLKGCFSGASGGGYYLSQMSTIKISNQRGFERLQFIICSRMYFTMLFGSLLFFTLSETPRMSPASLTKYSMSLFSHLFVH